MSLQRHNFGELKIPSAVLLSILLLILAGRSNGAPSAGQKAFATPGEATEALIKAAGDFNVPALLEILGPNARDLVISDDPVQDKNRASTFASLARDKVSVTMRSKNRDRAELVVGNDDWPFPIPLVRQKGSWYFDTASGSREILFRRIGQNELDAIQICRGFVEAQQEYAETRHDGSEVSQYAQRIISTPGKQDGLAWQGPNGTWEGPVGEAVAKALAQGYTSKVPPFHGYYFKVLKGQGPAAPCMALSRLSRTRSYDRRFRSCSGAGAVSRHRCPDLHCQPGRDRLPKRSGTRNAVRSKGHGALQSRQDVATH